MNSHKGFSTRSIAFCNKHEVSKLLLWTYGQSVLVTNLGHLDNDVILLKLRENAFLS